MTLSEAQLRANRANAQKSTGPKTPEGKSKSRLNAFRHGITGQVINLPPEEMQAYLAFNKEQIQAHAPANPIEKQLAQTIIDTQWRLNASRAHELSLFADHHEKSEGMFQAERPEIEAAFTAMQVLSSKMNELKLISLYEQRLNRTLQTTMKQLDHRQAERKEREQKEMHKASMIQKMMTMKGEAYNPADDGFVFSTKRFEKFQSEETHFGEAVIAARVGYNLEKFKAAVGSTLPQHTGSGPQH
jgi:hypothetical protein